MHYSNSVAITEANALLLSDQRLGNVDAANRRAAGVDEGVSTWVEGRDVVARGRTNERLHTVAREVVRYPAATCRSRRNALGTRRV